MPSAFGIEALGKQHDRGAFRSGSEPLDKYLREQARQEADKLVAAPFVLVRDGSSVVVGYYTLSASSISAADIAPALARKMPRYKHLPVTLIGRLAVDESLKSQGRGGFLLSDALRRSARHAAEVAAMAVVVEAKDDDAAAFYEHFGFRALQIDRRRLYLPMKTVIELVQLSDPAE